MSKRRILTADKVSESLYSKLMEIKTPENQSLIVSIFKELDTRRKCYKLSGFDFKPHATEYIFPDFFKPLTLAGRTRLIPIEEAKQINFVKALVALANRLGQDEDYDSMMDRLESVSESSLSNNKLIEIIPEMLFAYTAVQPSTLILKLEYFFGAEVIDILDVHDVETNTGKPRLYKKRAKEHAELYLKGHTATEQRKKAKAATSTAE